jgi:2-hydroxy-6-oxonona-2,4-dienedioate hydrolase
LQEKGQPQRTTVSGHSIRYLDFGRPNNSAKDMVLMHGIGASAERWLRVAPTLSKYFRVVIPDIVGFGRSDKPTVEYTMDFFQDFISGFFANLNLNRPSIIASSFGGHIAAEYAARNSRGIDRLVLVSSAGIMRTSTPVLDGYIMAALYPTYENALAAFKSMAYDPSTVDEETVTDFVNRMRLPNAKYAFMSTLLGIRYAPLLRGRLAGIMAPTLILWGDADRMIPVQYAKEFREVPNSEIVVIKECGHTPYVEKPLTFNRIVLKFLAGKEVMA